ncbi:hypothetical protein, partial [uncultured Vibrio sp.]|uniref:hypothetical protein n=1 Tax=uncultured Vibrio sp. TaxID=114054 RepID=UPI00261348CF
MSLRQALQIIGGQAFSLEEDVVRRHVGFRLKYGYEWDAPKSAQTVSTMTARANASPSSRASTPSETSSSIAMTPQLKETLSVQRSTQRPSTSASSSFDQQTDALFGG